jgi:hypothetical protein
MVRTGSHGYLEWGFESSYASGGTADKKFGLQDRLSSLSLTNNRINLPSLNQNTLHSFAYGQQAGSASVSFVLSNPWIIGSVLGAPTTSTESGSLKKHLYPASGGLNKEPRTILLDVGFDGASADLVRTLKGGLVNTLSVSASVGGLVECTADISYGKETAPSTTLGAAPTKPVTANEFPYTFAHAELRVGGNLVAECQDANISLAQNGELLYGLNSHHAVDAYRRVLDITGSFRAAWVNKTLLEEVLEQIRAGTSSGTYSETVGGSPEFRLIFNKTDSIANNGTFTPSDQSIEISLTGLSISDLGISGFEPVEPIFEEINWQAKEITVKAYNLQTAEE